jgi:endo-1,4-beta-xylanase
MKRMNSNPAALGAAAVILALVLTACSGGTDSFVPVEDISGLSARMVAGTPQALSGTVVPENATYKTIVWSLKNGGNTGASISGDTLSAGAEGTVQLTAVIANGKDGGGSYTKNFQVTVLPTSFVAVSSIVAGPVSTVAGNPLILNGTVEPENATDKDITWSLADAGSTGALVTGNTLTASAAGTVRVTAAIENGTLDGAYTQNFTITVRAAPAGGFVAVRGITGVTQTTEARISLVLAGTVSPDTATNQAISWRLADAGTTGAALSGNTLTTATAGTVRLIATIADGQVTGPYTQNFEITVTPAPGEFVSVTSIGLSGSGTIAGDPLLLIGTVIPYYATYKDITWTVADRGSTGASIAGNTLTTSAPGTAKLTATVANGKALGSAYTQDFPIMVRPVNFREVSGIYDVPDETTAGVPLSLSGSISPYDATNQKISWSVKSENGTGASINGNTFIAAAAGTATITAVIADGTISGRYVQDFDIEVVFTPVNDIYDVPVEAYVDSPLYLDGYVYPPDASNTAITWSVKDPGSTGAYIDGAAFIATAPGTAMITARIANGRAPGRDFERDFYIEVEEFIPPNNAPGIIYITVGFDRDIVIEGDWGSNVIYKSGSPSRLDLNAGDEYGNVSWYVDGAIQSFGNRFTIEAANFTTQIHSLTFVGYIDGKPWAKIIDFTVLD